ncbi:uncharacterized protein LOC127841810 [Dreissena polymorpha]|uniref:uncharacterized protein LOC127841810 n=1 Tax=Dreissena polymorpha TaxID=45954 RepID=UPI0022652AA0|nr:uncharacterized protein LOC127841810 [Dreissena polymorpha]
MCGIVPALVSLYVWDSTCTSQPGPEGLDTVVPTATLRPITSVPQISSSQLAQLLLLRQLPGLGKQLITRQQEVGFVRALIFWYSMFLDIFKKYQWFSAHSSAVDGHPPAAEAGQHQTTAASAADVQQTAAADGLSIHGPGTATHSPSPLTGQELSAPSPGPTGELTHPGHRVVHTQDSLPGYREAVNMERVRHMSDVHPLINTCADLSLSSDLMDASIYASSPNSLYMYDQEKMDMQCTMGINSTCCTTLDTSSLSDDFDLNSQYEMSHDISSFQVDPVTVSNSQVPRYNVSSTSLASAGSWSVIGKTDDLTHEDVYVSTTDERKNTDTRRTEL